MIDQSDADRLSKKVNNCPADLPYTMHYVNPFSLKGEGQKDEASCTYGSFNRWFPMETEIRSEVKKMEKHKVVQI